MAKHWKIVGVDNLQPFFEQLVPIRQISDKGVVDLLKRLASRHLTPEEVIDCSRRKDAVGHRDLLRVVNETKPGKVLLYTTLDPHYLATVVDIP